MKTNGSARHIRLLSTPRQSRSDGDTQQSKSASGETINYDMKSGLDEVMTTTKDVQTTLDDTEDEKNERQQQQQLLLLILTMKATKVAADGTSVILPLEQKTRRAAAGPPRALGAVRQRCHRTMEWWRCGLGWIGPG